MFDEVTKKEGGKAAARRAGYVFGSTVFQGVLIAAIITASAAIKAKVIDEPVKEGDPQVGARVAQVYGAAQYEAYVASLRSRADIEINASILEKK